MSSLDPETLQYLDGAVRATVQDRKKFLSVSQVVDDILKRRLILSREVLEKNKELIFEFWLTHTNAPDAPPSPPPEGTKVGHRGSNGSSAIEESGSEDTPIIPVEDPMKTEIVSIAIHAEKSNKWQGIRGLYGMRKETFISQKIVTRCNLPVEDAKVYLTWFLGAEAQTYKTCFFVVPSDQLASDCLLGTHCQKGDEENGEQHDDDDEQNSEDSQARSEMFIDSSLCQISPKGFPVQEQLPVPTALAQMNADSLYRYNQRVLENGGYNISNRRRS